MIIVCIRVSHVCARALMILRCYSSASFQVPINNEEKAVEFVKGLVPSAVVTQRHMGALSFNVQQLQVHHALDIL